MTDEIVSASLIRKRPRVLLSKEEQKRFCLGLAGWCPCDDCQSDESSIVANPVEESAVTNDKKSLKLIYFVLFSAVNHVKIQSHK